MTKNTIKKLQQVELQRVCTKKGILVLSRINIRNIMMGIEYIEYSIRLYTNDNKSKCIMNNIDSGKVEAFFYGIIYGIESI